MADKILVIDTATGRTKASTDVSTLVTNPSVTVTTVSAATQTNFTASSGTIASGNRLEVFINGLLQIEGAGESYTRNTGLNRIEFVTPVIQGAVVIIRVY